MLHGRAYSGTGPTKMTDQREPRLQEKEICNLYMFPNVVHPLWVLYTAVKMQTRVAGR
jgi:hypothetical protein